MLVNIKFRQWDTPDWGEGKSPDLTEGILEVDPIELKGYTFKGEYSGQLHRGFFYYHTDRLTSGSFMFDEITVGVDLVLGQHSWQSGACHLYPKSFCKFAEGSTEPGYQFLPGKTPLPFTVFFNKSEDAVKFLQHPTWETLNRLNVSIKRD